MTPISNHLPPATAARSLNRTPEALSRSLSRLAAEAKTTDSADVTNAARSTRLNAERTAAQTSLSKVQAAGGFIGTMSAAGERLGQLADLAQDPAAGAADVAKYQQEFQSLQDKLRSIIGGSTGEIGGTTDVPAQGSFQGQALFDAGATDLRRGAMLELIGQNSAGQYGLTAIDAEAGDKIRAAAEQLRTAQTATDASAEALTLKASTLEVENQNLGAAFPGIPDLDGALKATISAKGDILGQFAAMLRAQGNPSPQSVLKVLGD